MNASIFRRASSLPLPRVPSMTPPSNFQVSFGSALSDYKKRTREDLLLHPLASKLQTCDSPDLIFSVIEEQTRPRDQSQSGNERSTQLQWLRLAVDVLYPLSRSINESAGLVTIYVYSFKNCAFTVHFLGVIACESHFCWHWCLPLSEYLP
jgi:hypothetical protein